MFQTIHGFQTTQHNVWSIYFVKTKLSNINVDYFHKF